MGATRSIWKRELTAVVRSPVGWVVASIFLFISGVLFQYLALDKELLSADRRKIA